MFEAVLAEVEELDPGKVRRRRDSASSTRSRDAWCRIGQQVAFGLTEE
jgi:hypothetical protein